MKTSRREFLAASLTSITIGYAGAGEKQKPATAKIYLPPLKPGDKMLEYDFADLVDMNGNSLLASEIDGKYLLVYGGYLECTGVCPGAALSLVGAMKELKTKNPELAEKIIPVVVMIKNQPGNNLAAVQKRAEKWQTEGLEGSQTGIRVFVSDNEDVLKKFKTAFGAEISPGTDGQLNHSSWAYLFDSNGEMLHNGPDYKPGLIHTQKGSALMMYELEQRIPIKNRGASPRPGL